MPLRGEEGEERYEGSLPSLLTYSLPWQAWVVGSQKMPVRVGVWGQDE